MKRRRHTPEQIIRKLREAERMLGEGRQIPEVTKELGVSEATFHRLRNQYGGMKADEVKRLKELERHIPNSCWRGRTPGKGAPAIVEHVRVDSHLALVDDSIGDHLHCRDRHTGTIGGSRGSDDHVVPFDAENPILVAARDRMHRATDHAGEECACVDPRCGHGPEATAAAYDIKMTPESPQPAPVEPAAEARRTLHPPDG